MSSFSGRFKYLDTDGAVCQEGACRLGFDEESLVLTPGAGAPLVCDLGDIEAFSPADYELSLKLYTGKTILLAHFAKTYQNLCHDLLEAYRGRLIQCLLLKDLDEISRFDGFARLESTEVSLSNRAEVRLYKSNLAVLPESGCGFSWRLADIDSVDFDEPTYTLRLRSGQDRLILTRLAKRTREFIDSLREVMAQVAEKSATTLHDLFPFLTPDQLRRAAELLMEGRVASLTQLQAIHSRIESALLEKAVDGTLKPYVDFLKRRVEAEGYYAGLKLIRKELEENVDAALEGPPAGQTAETAGEESAESEALEIEAAPSEEARNDSGEDTVLHWFFFPLKGSNTAAKVVAWEAASGSGRATYFFRLPPPALAAGSIAEAIRQLNRAIVQLNFRREPIYLPEESLEMQPRFRRYAIACRRIPALRQLRASFLGRALHTSLAAWQRQIESILAKA